MSELRRYREFVNELTPLEFRRPNIRKKNDQEKNQEKPTPNSSATGIRSNPTKSSSNTSGRNEKKTQTFFLELF